MDAAVGPLLDALESGVAADLVRVVALRGFGLRDASDGAVVVDGELRGSVLGGLADTTILTEATDGAGRRIVRATITDRAADDAGMVCGGSATLMLSPVSELPPDLARLLRSAQPVALVTAADGSTGDLVVTTRESFGSAGPESDQRALVEVARGQLAAGTTATTELVLPSTTYVISTIVPRTRLLVVGSGPMADAIRAQGELLGWDVMVDESVEFARDFVAGAGPADAIAVLSHDGAVDVPIFDAALGSSIGYVGGMGSRGTQTRRRTALSGLGHGALDIDRIHGPIGLDLGSRTPAETSVAIVAEILANRSGRVPTRLADVAGPING